MFATEQEFPAITAFLKLLASKFKTSYCFNVKRPMLVILLLCGAAFTLVTLFGDDSYSRLNTLQRSLEAQKSLNADLKQRVDSLDSEVRSIQVNDRELEKHARNELGLARPNELIFLFERESGGGVGQNSGGNAGNGSREQSVSKGHR